MLHNLTLPPDQYTLIEQGKRHIFTRHLPVYATGDTINFTLEGQREQLSFTITEIEKAHIFANYCCLSFSGSVDDLAVLNKPL